jgi:uncharacterized DUF497 family protein
LHGGRVEEFLSDGVCFEWDEAKARSNQAKHQVTFVEGATVFADPDAIYLPDPDHSDEEDRFLLVGLSRVSRISVVVSVKRGERFRIISVRKAAIQEVKVYEQRRYGEYGGRHQ